MQAYAELLPPTAVTHAVSLSFVNAHSQNLIVAKTSLLQVFEVKSIVNDKLNRANGTSVHPIQNGAHDTTQRRLALIGEYPISGAITSLAAVKLQESRSGGQALLVAVRDAKFSLVEWNPEVYGLSTVSIHYYEGEDLRGSPWAPTPFHLSSYLTVDPSSRCAALKFGQRHLAILPFHYESDLDLDEYDAQLDGAKDVSEQKPSVDEPSLRTQTPYGASFVLQLTALDQGILDPADLAFLHEYREPTLGVLYFERSPSNSTSVERRDVTTFAAFTLDIAQRARTPLQSITGLPSDLFRLLPLPLPIGGSLLVGTNELVHVDQSGKVYAVAVNSFAREQSSLQMSDQSELGLKLEGSLTCQIPGQPKSLLLVLNTGQFIALTFIMDGRSVSSIRIQVLSEASGNPQLGGEPSCTAMINSNLLFVGSLMADSAMFECSSTSSQLTRKRSHADMVGQAANEDSSEEEEDEDDLYGDGAPVKKALPTSAVGTQGDIVFKVVDKLDNLHPLGEPVLVPRKKRKTNRDQNTDDLSVEQLQLVLPTGCGTSGGLSLLSQQLYLDEQKMTDSTNVRSVHSLQIQDNQSHGLKDICAVTQEVDGQLKTSVHEINAQGVLVELASPDFEADIPTYHMDVLANKKRLVQVTQSEVRSYDADLKVSQMLPMEDEETETELRVQHVSSSDPYILVVRNDKSVALLKADSDGELEELEQSGSLAERQWMSGSVHSWGEANSEASLFLLTENGGLHVFSVDNLDSPIYVADDLCQLPQILTHERNFRRVNNPEKLVEILVANVGSSQSSCPYLFVRNELGDVEVYQPFHDNDEALDHIEPTSLRWLRKNCAVPGYQEDESDGEDQKDDASRLRSLTNVNGHDAVFVRGASPSLFLKESSSELCAVKLADPRTRDMCKLAAKSSSLAMLIVNGSGHLNSTELPARTTYGLNGWALQRISLGNEIEAVAYDVPTSLYTVSISREIPMPDELYNHWSNENDSTLRPTVLESSLHILHPDTWQLVDTFTFPNECERISALKSLSLETSQASKERRTFTVVGTTIDRGEDLPCLGGVYLFDIVQVAPDTNFPHPETTARKLKLIAHEEFRGPVTAVAEAGSQGLLTVAQGQKVLVRGLREDLPGQLLPVAFMDVACFVSDVKNLKGTGLSLIADAVKGVQLAGFEATPYRLTSLSHSRTKLQVLTCDFLPHEKTLFIVVADGDGNIHVLEYNPDNPKSVKGERLIHRSALHTAHQPTSSLLLPCPRSVSALGNDDPADGMDVDATPQHALILPATSGALIQLTPLSESTYRRLSSLQSHLSSVLPQHCAFNPRAYRNVDSEGLGYWGSAVDVSGRGMVDLGVVGRWRELGLRGRREAWGRVGGMEEVEVAKAEIEGCLGGVFRDVL
ncbi:MAG: hypothetical protein Q9162_000634 [Coniocarpon cinnabarinum]